MSKGNTSRTHEVIGTLVDLQRMNWRGEDQKGFLCATENQIISETVKGVIYRDKTNFLKGFIWTNIFKKRSIKRRPSI